MSRVADDERRRLVEELRKAMEEYYQLLAKLQETWRRIYELRMKLLESPITPTPPPGVTPFPLPPIIIPPSGEVRVPMLPVRPIEKPRGPPRREVTILPMPPVRPIIPTPRVPEKAPRAPVAPSPTPPIPMPLPTPVPLPTPEQPRIPPIRPGPEQPRIPPIRPGERPAMQLFRSIISFVERLRGERVEQLTPPPTTAPLVYQNIPIEAGVESK